MDDGYLVFEYNLIIIERYIARSKEKLGPGRHVIVPVPSLAKPGAPADVTMNVDGKES